MPTDYPTSVDTFERPSTADGGTRYLADITRYDLIDDIMDAVEAMQGDMVPAGAGTLESVTGLSVAESYAGSVHTTIFTLAATPITVGNTTGVSFGGVQLYTFPSNGNDLLVLSSVCDLTLGFANGGNATPIDNADGGDFSMGTTAPDDGTLSGTDANIVSSTSIDPLSGTLIGVKDTQSLLSAGSAAYFNMLIDDADVGDGASDVLELNGYAVIRWIDVGSP